jgi:hypothetical protein
VGVVNTPLGYFPTIPSQLPALEAKDDVLNNVGPMVPVRSPIDQAIIDDVKNNTTSSWNPNSVSYPNIPFVQRPASFDTDRDGMPNDWEVRQGFNPNDTSDGNNVNADGYTNLEHYLHSLSGSVFVPTLSANAGQDQSITLPENQVTLSGSINDPDNTGNVTLTWSHDSGPGTVTFSDTHSLNSTVTFPGEGTYILRLTVDNGNDTSFDTIRITVEPAPFTVFRTGQAPVIDGNVAEFAQAVPLTVAAPDGGQGTYRLMWDETALYVAASVTDADLVSHGDTEDDEVYNEDGIELFFDTGHEQSVPLDGNDYKFVVNLKNTHWDINEWNLSWNSTWESAVQNNGSLNVSGDSDTGYTLEMAIPWSHWGIGVPVDGTLWGFEIKLNDLDASGFDYGLWNNPDKAGVNFNSPATWGEMMFSSATGAEPTSPKPPTGLGFSSSP